MTIEPSNLSRFIETDPIGRAGEQTEQAVWDAFKSAFSGRDCLGYWRYPIFSRTGASRKEPDILMVDRTLGLVITEVKGITIEQITDINGHVWAFKDHYAESSSPYRQAEDHLYALLSYCDREQAIRRRVRGRVLVALPRITESQWQARGFDRLPGCPPIVFRDHLGPKTLLKRIETTSPVESGKMLDDEQWRILLSVVGGTSVIQPPRPAMASSPVGGRPSRATIIRQLNEKLYELDLQQAHIGLEIPPGAQRIRGIAGSGKTVLLCQKVANMHLKHPDWDIALVFFTRSLYGQIETLIDKWLKHFSCGELSYQEPRVRRKLRILHAWGGRDRPGLYSIVCRQHGKAALTVRDSGYRRPGESLADVCQQLLKTTPEIKPLFDAIVIDEGQDLVADPEELRFQDKQTIYWLAWQALKPIDVQNPASKRLIWAYDEAQSLDATTIPTASSMFGPEFRDLVRGSHKGGIKKSEVMRRCYRVPGPILTAAHAIGMGFLRPGGMLSGITDQQDWQNIGYEVEEGDFRKNNRIKLFRPDAYSPNPVPQLWGESVIDFKTYASRADELAALARNIHNNLTVDGLQPSRQILVLVLAHNYDVAGFERDVARTLMEYGLDIFVATGTRLNQIAPEYPDNDPDAFWYPGGVTVSRVARAKGNEADMVYLVGLDHIARRSDEVAMRNQLFIGMTRARGWVAISGTGDYPLYDELREVIRSGNSFTFEYTRSAPVRDLSDSD